MGGERERESERVRDTVNVREGEREWGKGKVTN